MARVNPYEYKCKLCGHKNHNKNLMKIHFMQEHIDDYLEKDYTGNPKYLQMLKDKLYEKRR